MNKVYLVWLHYPSSFSGSLIAIYSERKLAEQFIKIADPDIRRSLHIQEQPVLTGMPE